MTFRLPVALLLFLAACSTTVERIESEPGSAPEIANLSFQPTEAKVGETTILKGDLTFEDADGDIETLAIEVRVPGATEMQAMPRQALDVGATSGGKIALLVAFAAPAAGDYDFAVYVVDAKGNESNRLEGVVHAK